MTYEQWRVGLSGDEKGGTVYAQKVQRNKETDKLQFKKYRNILGKNAVKSLDEFQNLKYNDTESWKEIVTLLRSNNYLQEQLSYKYNGDKLFIPRHTTFDKIKVIAGAKSETPIKVVDKLISQYGGTADCWQKKAAKIKSEKYSYDVHWFELDGVQYKVKVKNRSDRRKSK